MGLINDGVVMTGWNWLLRRIWWLAIPWLAIQPVARAAPATKAPVITAGPPKTVEAMRGDVVKLRIKFKANNNLVQQVKWVIRSQSLICRDVVCTLRTSTVQPGSHAIYVVVFDESGSDSLKFDLKVTEPEKGRTPKIVQVVPEVVSDDRRKEDRPETTSTAFFAKHVAVPAVGRAYSHSRAVVRVMGQGGESLEGSDTLRTGSPGMLRFALPGADESWILDASTLKLRGRPGSRGIARLERGTIRSRAINNADPGWDVAAGGYVFRGDGKRDLVVQRLPGDEILVTALRGNFRIHTEATFKGQADEETFFKIRAGAMIRLRALNAATGADPSRPEEAGSPAEQEAVAAIIRRTTPQYLAKRDSAGVDLPPFIRNRKPTSLDEAIKSARTALDGEDPWLGLEPILYRLDEAGNSSEASYLAGRSYVEMMLLPEGEQWLQKALEAANNERAVNDARIMLGFLNYKRRSWFNAATYFTSANLDAWLQDPRLGGERSYIAGKSCALGEQRSCARRSLPRASKEGPTPSAREEARLLLKKLDLLPGHTRFASLRLGYNSNIFGLEKPGDTESLPEGLSTNQTGLWIVSGGLASRSSASDELPQDDQNRFGLEFNLDLERGGYFNAAATNYARSTYKGHLGVFYTKASKPKATENTSGSEPALDLGIHAYVIVGGVGSQRVHDEGGAGITLSLPWMMGLDLGYRQGRVVDPQPELEHRIEYLTGEPSKSADDTGTISRTSLRVVPIGPNSLVGEQKGTSQVAIEAGRTHASRQNDPTGTGPVTIIRPALLVSRKVLENAVMTLDLGTETITRDISAADSLAMALPTSQSKTVLGLQFRANLTNAISMDLDAHHFISSSTGSGSSSFKRSIATLGTRFEF
jgi:hypothetical protein